MGSFGGTPCISEGVGTFGVSFGRCGDGSAFEYLRYLYTAATYLSSASNVQA